MADLGAIGTGLGMTPATTGLGAGDFGLYQIVPFMHRLAVWRSSVVQDGASYWPTKVAAVAGGASNPSMLLLSVPTNGTLAVNVKESGVNLAGCKVALYYRSTGALVSLGWTDASGNCTFYGLDTTESEAYMAVAFDPAGGTSYNAAVYDKLTAV